MSSRAVALAALAEWRRGWQFADAVIQQLLAKSDLSAVDRGFATELFYGVLRNLTLLDFWLAQLRSGALDHASRDLLRLGLYQLFCLGIPAHAAVFETVALGARRNRGLINGVLRAALRREAELRRLADAQPLSVRQSHPQFLLDRWQAALGKDRTLALARWNNQPAAIYARVNRLRTALEQFIAAHPTAEELRGWRNFVRLAEIPREALARGECYIQDPSTSLACELLDPQPGETVLDACAAPGGKSGLLAEQVNNTGRLIACDRDPQRLQLLRENLDRLGVTCATVVQVDWTAEPRRAELHDITFNRILLDAPCSNTGVMRRRVDARWRLTPNDFARMQHEQLTILRALVPLLRPDGVLVYSTCSIEAEENEQVIERALAEFPFLRVEEQRSVLPFRDHFDGAFAARLKRL